MAILGWVGSLKALIIPGAANAFGIFWMRQYFRTRSTTNWSRPPRWTAAASSAVLARRAADGAAGAGVPRHLHLRRAWNDYIWPLIVLTNPDTSPCRWRCPR